MPRTLLCIALCLAACSRGEVTHYRVKKPATAASAPPSREAGDPGSDVDASRPASRLAWTLPPGWTQSQGDGMRFATLKPAAGDVDVSVVVLPGDAGGELANVNRWRGQLGIAPWDEAAANKARATVETPAGKFALYDFHSESKRMIAALATFGGNTWFLKMVGEPRAVAAARRDLFRLLGDLHVEA